MLGFSTVQGGSVPLTPILFKGQLYFLICLVISSLTHGLFRTFFFSCRHFAAINLPLSTALAVPTSPG